MLGKVNSVCPILWVIKEDRDEVIDETIHPGHVNDVGASTKVFRAQA
jgi:hypothetical protein